MSHYLRTTQDRSVATVSGGLNERFGRIEKPAPVIKASPRVQKNPSVFSRIGRPGVPSSSPRSSPLGIQSRLGRNVGGGGHVQKHGVNTRLKPRDTSIKRGKQTIQAKGKSVQQSKGRAAPSKPRGGKKAVVGRSKKPVTSDDLDKALDSYMLKDPKTAQARLNDELDSYMDEAGDVLMDL